jgi:poly(3-hydroxybutyrate) depolymerase
MSSGMNRTYYVHVPQNYSSNDQHPAIVGFHGRGGTGLYFAADTRLSEAQFTGDSIMVYPDGVDRTWAGASYSAVSVEQDLQFVWDVLAKVRSDYCVNSARLYATGHSNGGGLVNLIACNATVGAEFAAFAPVSGAFYENQYDGSGCKPARNVMPMLEIHGVEDQVISYKGGKGRGGELPSITDWYVMFPTDEIPSLLCTQREENLIMPALTKVKSCAHQVVRMGEKGWL